MEQLSPLPLTCIELRDPELLRRRNENRTYLMRLDSGNLLRNHLTEAGLWSHPGRPYDIHWGWESPTCQLRGHFLGHWLSAAAMNASATGDWELKAKADAIVHDLARCQQINGGEWVGSIPEKYLDLMVRGQPMWAPHYTLHKTLMGLLDMHSHTGNDEALAISDRWAAWFKRWTNQFSREEMDAVLDVETGGMLESWSELYAKTGDADHRLLLERYTRSRLFDPLLRGEDVLTNMHANTTIPEVLGAARAFEVLGDERWLRIVKAYWDMAVTRRGRWATGGQTCGEVWTPMNEQSARLGDKNQEHCTVYNMMRLAEFLLRHTGEAQYADYWEQNLTNGIMAQGYWRAMRPANEHSSEPETGILTYFLPLRAGSTKNWATETESFFCCHGTLVQANATHASGIWYQDPQGLTVAQLIPSNVGWKRDQETVDVSLNRDHQSGGMQAIDGVAAATPRRPDRVVVAIGVHSAKPIDFRLRIRVPWWTDGPPAVFINGERAKDAAVDSGFVALKRPWRDDVIRVEFPKKLSVWPLADRPETVAFMDGPVVLAGLCDEERTLYGDLGRPETLLVPDNEREWTAWTGHYRTIGQDRGIRFIPLHRVGFETYSVYFPVRSVREEGP